MNLRTAVVVSTLGLLLPFSPFASSAGAPGSRMAVLWEDQGLWYGTSSDLVTTGEEFAAFLLQKLEGERSVASAESTVEPPFIVLIGTSDGLEELQVTPTSIRTSKGVIALSPEEFARFEHFVHVRPLDNRLHGPAAELLARSYAYVDEATVASSR